MHILIWIAEHSTWISCVALIVVVPLKFERWLPKRVKKYLFIADMFIIVSTPLLGALKEKLDDIWKLEIKKQTVEIMSLKQANKATHLNYSTALSDNRMLKKQIEHLKTAPVDVKRLSGGTVYLVAPH
jgi:hypothetical protein